MNKKGFLERKIKTTQTVDGERQIIELDDSACFIPRTKDGYYIFSRQFRASRGSESTSVYGGYVDKGETPKSTAIREMFEEANITQMCIDRAETIYEELYPSSGICTEKNSLYIIHLNKNLDELDIKSNDENESITPLFVLGKSVAGLEFDGMKAWIGQQYIVNKLKEERPMYRFARFVESLFE